MYVVADLDDLVTFHASGMGEGWVVYTSMEDAEERAYEMDQMIVSIEVDDLEAVLGPDTDSIDYAAERLLEVARPAEEGDVDTGMFSNWEGEPLTWDDPFELEQAAILKKFSDEGMTWQESLDVYGSAMFLGHVPPDQILLESPVDLSEIEDRAAYRAAVEAMEPVALTSLGGSFWVWILFILQNAFAIARGEIDVAPVWKQQAAEDKAAARRERRRKSAALRRKAKKRQSTRRKRDS